MLKEKIAIRLKALTDHRYRQFYLQRFVKDVRSRGDRADRVAARLPKLPTYSSAEGETSQTTGEMSQTLKDRGYLFVPGLVRPEWIADMVAFFKERECSNPYQTALGKFRAPANVPAGTHVAYFDNEVVACAPHAFEIANDPKVLEIVSDMLGAKPTISYMTAWWSLPAGDGKALQAENFHRDVDDWRFVKLFCYLTDVDESSGPHMFVQGSHNINKLTEIRRFSDEEVISTFGPENVVRFTGTAGTAFLENTYGIHRGFPPASKPRLIYQVLYSLRPVIYGPKTPVAKIGSNGIPNNIDPYINRVYCFQ